MAPKELRTYQKKIVETAVAVNTIVLLPTGSGKTLIAAEAIARTGHPSLFFVPTIPLVAQQAAAIRAHLPAATVGEYHGECALPAMFNVLVTTPKAFEVAQSRGVASLAWGNFNAVVFDEVHHAIKDHPYRNLALKLRHSTSNPRVIGLTASLTYAVGDEKINKSVGKLCQELGIEKIESATDEELRSGGYTGAGRGAIAEVRLPDVTMTDHLVPIQDRKPHLMHSTFFDRIKKSTATSFSTTLVNTIRVLEDAVKLDMHDFKSPLLNVSLKTWGEYAKKKSNRHAMFLVLEHFYEALKLLVISWEEHQDIALIYLQMMKVDSAIPSNKQPQATSAIKAFFETQWRSVSLGRLENLYKVLNEKLQDYGQDFRCILFVKQRLTTHILKYAIESHTILGNRVTAQCIYSTKTSATASLSVSKQASKDAIRAFEIGSSNMLISTSVAEEGLDIPEANCVIYFDAMDHAVSYVQGRGRARHIKSSFVMLNEREDRPASVLAKQEAQQHAVASSFVPKNSAANTKVDEEAQKCRERGASKYLLNPTEDNCVANLNIYCKKTKVALEENVVKSKTSNCFFFKLSYRSPTLTASGSGSAQSKKKAKKIAAIELLKVIKSSAQRSEIM